MDDEELQKHLEEIDLNKVGGRYLHFGHFIQDVQVQPSTTFGNFYGELFEFHKSYLLAIEATQENLDTIKDMFIQSLEWIIENIKNVTLEELKNTSEQIINTLKQDIPELKKLFGKKDYFT